MVQLGAEQYTYEIAEGWGNLPDGWKFKEVAAVGVDASDNVYAFNRGEHPMIIFDKKGNFLRSWGEGIFPRAHGITMNPDDTMFCTDDGDHTVRKCTLDGKVLFTLGISGQPAPFMSGDPFNRCTHVAVDPRNGDFYVTDGYGNAPGTQVLPRRKPPLLLGRVRHRGRANSTSPTTSCTDREGWVYVADRENHRVQIFDSNGRFETQWINMARPCGLYIDQETGLVYVGELGAAIGPNLAATGLGPRISIYDTSGNLIARLGNRGEGFETGQFMAPHGVCIDSRADIYVGEVSWTHTRSYSNPPDDPRTLQKLVKKG